MHEYSIVQALLDQCEDIAQENEATKVTKVVCKIGIMSGIETHLLQTAFDTFKEKTICESADFIINQQKLKLLCQECQNEFELDDIVYKCVKCDSLNVKVIDGEEMYLMSLEME
jgi:hydrogenase nickel insertion protein HypA